MNELLRAFQHHYHVTRTAEGFRFGYFNRAIGQVRVEKGGRVICEDWRTGKKEVMRVEYTSGR